MLELYVEALLADPEMADQVWELWDRGLVSDGQATCAWTLIALVNSIGSGSHSYYLDEKAAIESRRVHLIA